MQADERVGQSFIRDSVENGRVGKVDSIALDLNLFKPCGFATRMDSGSQRTSVGSPP